MQKRRKNLKMNLITAENLCKSYTDKVLFDQITLGINEHDKIGVIGVNGTGKSTLLRFLAGIEEPDKGEVIKGNQVRVEYLSQTPTFDDDSSILMNIVKSVGVYQDGWNVEGEAKSMLGKLGIMQVDAKPSTLSGGQRKRAALVRALLHPSDVLILDEPTNHLDNDMAEWLENYLNQYRGAIIMVTHDRYFLDKVINKIVEIDKGKLYTYIANYSGFLQLKAEREEMEIATERKNKSLYRKDLEWMMRGARARSTKQKAHIQRFEELRDREKPEETKKVEMGSISSRLGKKTIEINKISKAYGEKKLIEDFTYIFLRDDRIGIVGKNGIGKSTLLKIINGTVEPDRGEVSMGPTVKVGYFSQESQELNPKDKVIDYIKEVAEYIETPEGVITAGKMLERFLFTGGLQYSLIEKLSGGEKRRLHLLRILMGAPNVLILDEPTNDLDIQTLSILEDYLDHFDGIVITVSHDRYFLDRIVNRIFAFEGNGVVKQYEGGFSDYQEKNRPLVEKESMPKKKGKVEKPRHNEKKKFTYQEQKEFTQIDDVIARLEETLGRIEQDIIESARDFVKLNQLTKEKEETEVLIEEKMERWVYLNDLAEQIEEQGKA